MPHTKSRWFQNPDPCNSNPSPIFVRADRGAGCTWARVIHCDGNRIFCLSPAGVRYYGIPDELDILVPGDEGYEDVRAAWQRALATLPKQEAPEQSLQEGLQQIVKDLERWWDLGEFATDVHPLQQRILSYLEGAASRDEEPSLSEFPPELRAKLDALVSDGPTPAIRASAEEFLRVVDKEARPRPPDV